MKGALPIALVALIVAPAWASETFTARVVGVTDGDTVKVLTQNDQERKVRLSGIDAPERKQPFGQRSKEHLSDLVFGRDVVLECRKVDRYKRDICVIQVNGQDANLAQIEAGLAWWYRKYAKEQPPIEQTRYEQAEAAARTGRMGLWSEPQPVPPWEWRHRK